MPDKPRTADEYRAYPIDVIRETCLYVATVLGDVMESDLVVVGGVVPSLLLPAGGLPAGVEPHVGTVDLDLGLRSELLDRARYQAVSERLRTAGFTACVNERGKVTRQTWRIEGTQGGATIDFLIPGRELLAKADRLQNLERDWAAVITPALPLAFRNRALVDLAGRTIHGERAERRIPVCGAGAFVVLKAIAFRNRGEPKDAYDLFFVVRNFGSGPEAVAGELSPLLDDAWARKAIDYLDEDFCEIDSVGPKRVAKFLGREGDDALLAEVRGNVIDLVNRCRSVPRPRRRPATRR